MGDAFRITFNRPAAAAFWSSDASGMLIRIENGQPAFLPAAYSDADEWHGAKAEARTRGGKSFEIAGTNGPDLLAALRSLGASSSRPYFVLHRRGDGWLGLTHYKSDGIPSRTQPAMRLWVGSNGERPHAASEPADTYTDAVRAASKVVLAWQNERRRGRKPREVESAESVLAEFVRLVREVQPALLTEGVLDLEAIRRARDALSEVLAGIPTAENDGPSL